MEANVLHNLFECRVSLKSKSCCNFLNANKYKSSSKKFYENALMKAKEERKRTTQKGTICVAHRN